MQKNGLQRNSHKTELDDTKPIGEVKVRNGYADISNMSKCLLLILPVKVRLGSSGELVTTQAFLDQGSTGSFITTGLIKKL